MREGKNRLTISDDLQISFDENGKACYSSKSRKTPEAVESEVQRWQAFVGEFVEDWLQAHELPGREREHSREEETFLRSSRQYLSKTMRRGGHLAREIEGPVRSLLRAVGSAWGFSPEQTDRLVSEALDTLQETAQDMPGGKR
jgi:hypothetical protein